MSIMFRPHVYKFAIIASVIAIVVIMITTIQIQQQKEVKAVTNAGLANLLKINAQLERIVGANPSDECLAQASALNDEVSAAVLGNNQTYADHPPTIEEKAPACVAYLK